MPYGTNSYGSAPYGGLVEGAPPAPPVALVTFDNLILSPSATAPPFFDGNSGGCAWSGIQFFSPSERLGTAADLGFMSQVAAPYWSATDTVLADAG
jgi:hypothetical protein